MKKDRIVRSSIIVMSFVIVGKILAFLRDAMVASKFGTTYSTDIYMFSIGVVYLLTTVSYGLTTTFIPIQTDHIENEDKIKNNEFVNNLLNIFVIFTIIFTILGILFSKYIIIVFAPGFTKVPDVFLSSVNMLRIMFLSLMFISAQSVITGVLQAHKNFFIPAIMATCSNIVYIIYLLTLADKFGITGFAISTVIGFFIQLLINIPEYHKLGYRYKFHIDLKDKEIKKLFLLMLPVIISTSTVQLNLFVNRYFATNIYEGAVSILDFSNKLNTIVDEVFATSISMVIYPSLSSFAANNNVMEYKRTLIKSLNVILMVMIPAAAATAVLRFPLITVIFKRGQFDLNSLNLTAAALLFYTPSMIASGIRGILNKAFYSIQDVKTPMINSIIGMIFNGILSLILVGKYKVSGLTLASSIAALITIGLLMIDLNKSIKDLPNIKILKALGKIIFSTTIMSFAIFISNKSILKFFGSSMKGSLLSLIINLFIGSFVYFLCISLTKVEEYTYLVSLIRDRLGKSIKKP